MATPNEQLAQQASGENTVNKVIDRQVGSYQDLQVNPNVSPPPQTTKPIRLGS